MTSRGGALHLRGEASISTPFHTRIALSWLKDGSRWPLSRFARRRSLTFRGGLNRSKIDHGSA
jgi:hypothetical protein